MANGCKYEKLRKYVSYDNGNTWSPLNDYMKGELIEYDSNDCPNGIEPDEPRKYRVLIITKSGTFSIACIGDDTLKRPSVLEVQDTATILKTGDCCKVIDAGTFMNFTSLVDVDMSNSVTSINDHAFWNCTSLTNVKLSNSITSISEGTFMGCTSLPNITLPNSVEGISQAAFMGCTSLTSINIPNSIRTIGTQAFQGCTSLKSVTVNAVNPPTLGIYVFEDTNNCPIYVPDSSVNAYRTATNWSTYASRIFPMSQKP